MGDACGWLLSWMRVDGMCMTLHVTLVTYYIEKENLIVREDTLCISSIYDFL